MIFLPIVDRELRAAARKRNTFWLRVIAASVALLIGSGFMLLSLLPISPFGGGGKMGGPLFAVLTWLSLATALCAGLFFTSDCVSEEKREGTLGFLFLTDLRGYDVVLGKLLATSLRCIFGLVAIFPVLAITQLMGGVAVEQFWKTLLALLNALMLSLTVGLFVSAISRDSQKALMGTLFMLAALVFGGPIADAIFGWLHIRVLGGDLSLSSPGYVFVSAGRWRDPTFWPGLLVNQFIAWVLLGLACVLVPRTWQQRRTKNTVWQKGWSYAWRYGGTKRRAALRQKLMNRSPVLWLACRERWQSLTTWAAAALVMLFFAGALAVSLVSNVAMELWAIWGFMSGAFTLMIYLGTASQAGRFFVDAQRSGLIELLLAAPLQGKEIVQGHWHALLRMFGLPLALFLVVNTVGTFFANHVTWGQLAAATSMATTAPTAGVGTNSPSASGGTNAVSVRISRRSVSLGGLGGGGGRFTTQSVAFSLGMTLTTTLILVANLAALCWFGMWMGMTSKSANLATLKTLVFVQVIPWLAISFGASMIVGLFMVSSLVPALTKGTRPNPASIMMWFPLASVFVTCALSLGKDIFFFAMARRKLYGSFRDLAVRATVPIHSSVPTLPSVSKPPVVATKP